MNDLLHVADNFIMTVSLEYIYAKQIIVHHHTMTVLLEYIDLSLHYFYKCIEITINLLYMIPIVLALCLMLFITHFAQNYTGTIGGSLAIALCKCTTNQHKSYCVTVKEATNNQLFSYLLIFTYYIYQDMMNLALVILKWHNQLANLLSLIPHCKK